MGNQPSIQRPPTTSVTSSSSTAPAPTSATSSEPPTRTHSRRESKHPIPVANHRFAAPPEQSLAQAQGSTTASAAARDLKSALPEHQLRLPPAPAPAAPFGAGEPAKPVAVPNGSQAQSSHRYQPHVDFIRNASAAATAAHAHDTYEGGAMVPASSVQDMSYLTRPPRLPLPIEEEIHTPGSPIFSPDAAVAGSPIGPIEPLDSDERLRRKLSALSTGTLNPDDEEYGEEEPGDKSRQTVPSRLEWPGGGDKVYVTGTIFQWNRKHRLHPVEGKPGHFAATINVLPGTHHVRFLVDGLMQTSPDLPTTVDFGNNLVNYIEVSAAESTPAEAEKSDSADPKLSQQDLTDSRSVSQINEKTVRYKVVDPAESFESEIPQYLVDFDQPEDSRPYHISVGAIEKLPTPPTLPGFLNKPILNAAVPQKDDNSQLIIPNHTVLNHLATSSIKNNILAVSATTRYKSKYVTTIIYKPTSTDG